MTFRRSAMQAIVGQAFGQKIDSPGAVHDKSEMLIEFGGSGRGRTLEQFGVRANRTQGRSQIVAGTQEKPTRS